jgi:hypothetical protein
MTWRLWRSHDPVIETLIKPPTYTYLGHDETLEIAARQRRKDADRVRAEARRLDTRDDPRSRIHVVGR